MWDMDGRVYKMWIGRVYKIWMGGFIDVGYGWEGI